MTGEGEMGESLRKFRAIYDVSVFTGDISPGNLNRKIPFSLLLANASSWSWRVGHTARAVRRFVRSSRPTCGTWPVRGLGLLFESRCVGVNKNCGPSGLDPTEYH